MVDYLLIGIVGLLVIQTVLLVFILSRGTPARGLESSLNSLEKAQERVERLFLEEISKSREAAESSAREGRRELSGNLNSFQERLIQSMSEISRLQKNQLESIATHLNTLTRSNEGKLEQMRKTVEGKLKDLQEDNAKKLEQMRSTVDEKLHATLERRLGESFKLVSERLEQVHKGLGEMQTLASGVGDLKKVLTNVRTRGSWGEIQLGSLLEQILIPDQYAANVATNPNSSDRVEFAIRLPGPDGGEEPLWLPIDAKFPQEDYQRLLDAQEQGNAAQAEEASKALESRIRLEAKKVREKYICPPHTTDFAILFLPTEGLFAEVLRRPGLHDALQREHRVAVMGPTTLGAILNSLQMGFRTLAIEKRSSEVWKVLGAVKGEFGKFGEVLDKVRKKLNEASSTMDKAATRTRAMERKLRDVEALPADESSTILGGLEGKPFDDLAEGEKILPGPGSG